MNGQKAGNAGRTAGRPPRDPFRRYPLRLRQALEVASAIISRMSAKRLDSTASGA